MKIGVFTDIHFSYSESSMRLGRLDSLVYSFKWMYDTFNYNGVDLIVNCGDLFNSDIIKPEENVAITKALSYNSGIPELYLLGNHEMKSADSSKHSLSILDNYKNITVIDEPMKYNDEISFLPYRDHYTKSEMLKYKNKILFTHLDYIDMLYNSGKKVENGSSMDDIKESSELVINGHIHSYSKYNNTIYNIGSMVGHNFSDSYTKLPGVVILDTDSLSLEFIPNPVTVLYYKFNKVESLKDLVSNISEIESDNHNPKFIRVTTPYDKVAMISKYLDDKKSDKSIVDYKIISYQNPSNYNSNDTVEVEDSDSDINSYDNVLEALLDYADSVDNFPRPKSEVVAYLEKYYK